MPGRGGGNIWYYDFEKEFKKVYAQFWLSSIGPENFSWTVLYAILIPNGTVRNFKWYVRFKLKNPIREIVGRSHFLCLKKTTIPYILWFF